MTFLVAMKGRPGSGKSSVAFALSARLRWPVLGKDEILKAFHMIDPEWFVAHRRLIGRAAYDALWLLARPQLQSGIDVIVDTPLPRRRTYESALETAASCDATLVVVSAILEEEARLKRLRQRKLEQPHTHQINDELSAGAWDAKNPEYEIESQGHLFVRTNEHEQMIDDIDHIVLPFLGQSPTNM